MCLFRCKQSLMMICALIHNILPCLVKMLSHVKLVNFVNTLKRFLFEVYLNMNGDVSVALNFWAGKQRHPLFCFKVV